MFRSRREAKFENQVPAGGYVRDAAAGAIECQYCRTRAFSRNPLILALWEGAHSNACIERRRAATLTPDLAPS